MASFLCEPRQKRPKVFTELNEEQLHVLREFQVIINAAVHCSGNKQRKVSSYYGKGKSSLSRARVKVRSILSAWKQERIPEKCLDYIRRHDPSNAIIDRYGLDETDEPSDKEEVEDAAVNAIGPLFGDNDIAALTSMIASTPDDPNQNEEEGYHQNSTLNVTIVSDDDSQDDSSDDDSDDVFEHDELLSETAFLENNIPAASTADESIPLTFRDILRDWVADDNPPQSVVNGLLDRIHRNPVPIDHSSLEKNTRALLKVIIN